MTIRIPDQSLISGLRGSPQSVAQSDHRRSSNRKARWGYSEDSGKNLKAQRNNNSADVPVWNPPARPLLPNDPSPNVRDRECAAEDLKFAFEIPECLPSLLEVDNIKCSPLAFPPQCGQGILDGLENWDLLCLSETEILASSEGCSSANSYHDPSETVQRLRATRMRLTRKASLFSQFPTHGQ